MDVFHVSPENVREGALRLIGDEHHHLSRVMRMRPGELLYAADGAGTMYLAELRAVENDVSICVIRDRLPGMNEAPRAVTLAQAMLKQPARMDWLVEKSVELGVARLIPMRTARVIAQGDKSERWRELARAAMKQSQRCLCPPVDPPVLFERVFDLIGAAVPCICHEAADPASTLLRFAAELETTRPIAMLIGPEGGFSEAEIEHARARGAAVVSLGTRRLRSETAALTALARLTI